MCKNSPSACNHYTDLIGKVKHRWQNPSTHRALSFALGLIIILVKDLTLGLIFDPLSVQAVPQGFGRTGGQSTCEKSCFGWG